MILFVLIIILLNLLLLIRPCSFEPFTKDRVTPLRGILAIIIVLHHIYLTMGYSVLSQFKSLGAISVALFLFFSGYGLNKSYLKKGQSYLRGFLKHRILDSIVLPCSIAIVLQVIILMACGSTFTIETILENNGERWFVLAILYLYVLFYISARLQNARYMMIYILFGLALYVCLTYTLQLGRCWYISVWAFGVGVLYSKYEAEILNALNRFRWFKKAVVPLLLSAIALAYVLGAKSATFIAVCYSLVYALISLLVVILCSGIRVSLLNKSRIISFLSSISYELYLCHGVILLLMLNVVVPSSVKVLAVLSLSVIYAVCVKYLSDLVRKKLL